MSILSSKRQVTLPKELCDRLRFLPGDHLEFLENNSCISIIIIKKQPKASKGILSHLDSKKKVKDDESLADAISVDDVILGRSRT